PFATGRPERFGLGGLEWRGRLSIVPPQQGTGQSSSRILPFRRVSAAIGTRHGTAVGRGLEADSRRHALGSRARMRCNWWRWLWGIVPLLVLSWVAVQAEQSRIEADLRERAKLALTQAGMSWAATRFEGRDATLEGQAGDDAEPLRAGDLLRGVWGVRVVENRAELLPKVETFTWTARRRGNRIRIMGHVPNRATRKAILGVAKANFPGFEVVDRLETVRGVPSVDAWLGGVGFALKQLAALKRGDVHFKDLDMWIAGEAEDVASYRAVKSALANSVPKG